MKIAVSVLSCVLALSFLTSSPVQAQIPNEVMTSYKAYRTALKDKDAKGALKHAKAAWEAAEEHLGDHKTTGDLAQNYADINSGLTVSDSQIKAMKRAMDLSSFYGADGNETYLQRGVQLLGYYATNAELRRSQKLAKELVSFSKENGLDRTIFYAETLTLHAATYITSRDGEKMKKLTEEAIDVFENPADDYQSAYPIFAHLYKGFGHEYDEEILEAALSYQKVMDSVGKLEYETHPIVGRALGRWSHMRGRLRRTGELDNARAAGLCDCWPYDIERNESVKPLKRTPPRFPGRARRTSVSGFTIVQFDLDDKGNTINPKKIVSWPQGVYEEAALKSLKSWEYSPRVEGETDADRKNLITTIRFNIVDARGNPVY